MAILFEPEMAYLRSRTAAFRVGFSSSTFWRAMNLRGKVCGVQHGSVRWLSLSRGKNTRIHLCHRTTHLARIDWAHHTPDGRIDAGAPPAYSRASASRMHGGDSSTPMSSSSSSRPLW
jgi:hypothetical protein